MEVKTRGFRGRQKPHVFTSCKGQGGWETAAPQVSARGGGYSWGEVLGFGVGL